MRSKLTDKYAKYAGDPPDGGLKAWSVILAVLGTYRNDRGLFGYVNAWGICKDHSLAALFPSIVIDVVRSAWIGSVQPKIHYMSPCLSQPVFPPRYKYALVFLPGLVTGRLFDIGYFKIPYLFASCLLVACTFLVAECKVYWQFLLAQGLGIGLASGILIGPALGIVSHWFSKRRGLGAGCHRYRIIQVDNANLWVYTDPSTWCGKPYRRLPPQNVKGGLFNWTTFKNPAYAIYCISGVTTFLGLYTMLTYIPVSAVQAGIPNDFSFYFIAIANGASALGRILAGTFSGSNCHYDVRLAVCDKPRFSCGTYVSLLPAPVMSMGAVGDVGRRTGLLLSFAAFGALGGPPISGAINSATGGFEGVGCYAGGILLFSVCLMLLSRYLHLGKLAGKF
ncbi:MFS general substrate transporter [Boletus edulis]|nr:MFS general substrate transporter [Boletus edulis]